MILTRFETQLYEHLTPFFGEYGYDLLPEKKQYRLATPTGFQNILLAPAYYDGETVLTVNFGCRHEQIEQIAQQFLNNLSGYRPDANTLVVSIGKFSGQLYSRYTIGTDHQLADVCDQIQAFFTDLGFPFLDESGSLQDLDRLLNQFPDEPCRYVYNQAHRYHKGLTAAYLNHNPHADALTDTYRQQLTQQTQNPHAQFHFERLVNFLHHYSAN